MEQVVFDVYRLKVKGGGYKILGQCSLIILIQKV